MNSEMQKAFEKFFIKLEKLYAETFETKPTVPFLESYDKSMLIGMPDEDDEVQWIPKVQKGGYDWNKLELELGFSLFQEFRDFYSSYYFLALSGTFNGCELHFYSIDGSKKLREIILQNFRDAQYVFPNTECFLIGNAVINDDDSFFIYYDNANQKVFCYESDLKKEIVLSNSIAEIIGNMEANL